MSRAVTQLDHIAGTLDTLREPVENRRALTESGLRLIVSDRQQSSAPRFECGVCRDVGLVTVGDDGQPCPARRCECRLRRIVERGLAAIPRTFGVPRLDSLEPRPDLHPDQPAVVEHMKANPSDSYLFAGDNGTGKTHLAYALYVHALHAGRTCRALTVQSLLAEYKRMEMGESGENGQPFVAQVTPENLQSPSSRWTLLLDEFEKARVSEFTSEMLFALLDSAWKYGHQLIVTTNMPLGRLMDRWSRIDEVYGRSIVKRLSSMCIGVGFFFEAGAEEAGAGEH
jgi:hypothetical protein